MDVPSKFFNLEIKNGHRKFIHALWSEDGIILPDSASIRERAVGFYKELYSCGISNGQVDDRAFHDFFPQESEEANAAIGRVLTLDMLERALLSMESGKAPGVDGLPMDFWSELDKDVLTVLRDSLTRE